MQSEDSVAQKPKGTFNNSSPVVDASNQVIKEKPIKKPKNAQTQVTLGDWGRCVVIKIGPDFEYANDVSAYDEASKDRLSKRTKIEALSTEGIANDKKIEPVPNFTKAPCETLLCSGENNQWIVVGRDRPETFFLVMEVEAILNVGQLI